MTWGQPRLDAQDSNGIVRPHPALPGLGEGWGGGQCVGRGTQFFVKGETVMRRSIRWAWGLLALTVLLAGCSLLKIKHYDQDVGPLALSPKGVEGLLQTGPDPKDMDVTVTATTSPATPVTLYLVELGDGPPNKDADDRAQQNAQDEISSGHDPKSLVGKKSDQNPTPTLQVVAPAGKKYAVIVANGGAKDTQVTAKILGKY